MVVVDGSNIATEGRSTPSLSQLNDAVMAFRDEFPDAVVTVVVDATFGHRIDRKEAADFDAAVAHNEVVAPPAGAIGRGDAFVLSIANKVGARILSNDSFQEFHGDYPWLFDEGRLIGGKPVPFVGWVFVTRLPVKGPTSRKSQRASRGDDRPTRRTASKAASQPMPVPTAPPPGVRRANAAPVPVVEPTEANRPTGGPVNDVLPFLDFVEHHPIGSSVNGVVESYSSHGAYVSIGDVRGYVPLRLMSAPPPRSAREVMKVHDAATLVVTSFAPARRSIELAVPEMAPSADVVATPELEALAEAVTPTKRARKSTAAPAAPRKRAARKQVPADESAAVPAAEPPSRQRVSRKKQAAADSPPTVEPSAAPAPAPAKRAATRTKKQAGAATAAAAAPEAKKRAPAKRAASSGEPASTSTPTARRKRKAAAPETTEAEARS
ncbi:hypothetical protein BH18ACT2_BH18ACT2_03020 [soil metagenome]